MEDEEHIRRPAADAADRHQLGNDGLVVHLVPLLHVQPATVEVQRQVHQVLHLAGRQAGRTHVVHLELEHAARRHAARQGGELVPHALRRCHRHLLAHDGARQRGEGVAALAQGHVAHLGNQATHHTVLLGQMPAGLFPIAGGREGRMCIRYFFSSCHRLPHKPYMPI